jgi:phosphonoacetaldehyde hydrolase
MVPEEEEMEHTYQRSYRDPVRLVVLDWAGTTIDYGCIAPAVAFIEVFQRKGVEISMEQARRPMGLGKREHIQAICQQSEVASEWQHVYGRAVSAQDIQEMYSDFQPIQMRCLADYADLIPGTLEAVTALRLQGVRIGTTTGYFTEAMELIIKEAAWRGYQPDSNVCATQVRAGRPEPWMLIQNMVNLGIYPPEAVVKVDDTPPGIEEGLNAGTWTIGLAKTGNELGLSLEEVNATPPARLEALLSKARDALRRSGAHYVVDSIADVPGVIEDISQRLAMGEKP